MSMSFPGGLSDYLAFSGLSPGIASADGISILVWIKSTDVMSGTNITNHVSLSNDGSAEDNHFSIQNRQPANDVYYAKDRDSGSTFATYDSGSVGTFDGVWHPVLIVKQDGTDDFDIYVNVAANKVI